MEALREDLDSNNMTSKWINTRQMLADCLTKSDPRAADYLRHVLKTGYYQLTEDPKADQAIAEMRYNLKGQRGQYYRDKYPKRKRPSEQQYTNEGFTYYNDAVAEVRYGAKAAKNPPKWNHKYRMLLGQTADSEEYQTLEEVVDWSGLDVTRKRRKIPDLVQKLITVYGPTRKSVTDWYDDFKKTKKVREPDKHDEDPDKQVSIADHKSEIIGVAQDDCHQEIDEHEIYMMESENDAEFVLLGGGESASAAAAAATVAVCATCRMLLDQCECKPRTRKKQYNPESRVPAETVPVDQKSITQEVYDKTGKLTG